MNNFEVSSLQLAGVKAKQNDDDDEDFNLIIFLMIPFTSMHNVFYSGMN